MAFTVFSTNKRTIHVLTLSDSESKVNSIMLYAHQMENRCRYNSAIGCITKGRAKHGLAVVQDDFAAVGVVFSNDRIVGVRIGCVDSHVAKVNAPDEINSSLLPRLTWRPVQERTRMKPPPSSPNRSTANSPPCNWLGLIDTVVNQPTSPPSEFLQGFVPSYSRQANTC